MITKYSKKIVSGMMVFIFLLTIFPSVAFAEDTTNKSEEKITIPDVEKAENGDYYVDGVPYKKVEVEKDGRVNLICPYCGFKDEYVEDRNEYGDYLCGECSKSLIDVDLLAGFEWKKETLYDQDFYFINGVPYCGVIFASLDDSGNYDDRPVYITCPQCKKYQPLGRTVCSKCSGDLTAVKKYEVAQKAQKYDDYYAIDWELGIEPVVDITNNPNKKTQTISCPASASFTMDAVFVKGVTVSAQTKVKFLSFNPYIADFNDKGIITNAHPGTTKIMVVAEESEEYNAATAIIEVSVTLPKKAILLDAIYYIPGYILYPNAPYKLTHSEDDCKIDVEAAYIPCTYFNDEVTYKTQYIFQISKSKSFKKIAETFKSNDNWTVSKRKYKKGTFYVRTKVKVTMKRPNKANKVYETGWSNIVKVRIVE